MSTLRGHSWGRSVYQATDRELELLDALIHEGIPEVWREFCTRMDPAKQPQRERWLRENWQWAKRNRELTERRLAWHHEHGWSKPTPRHLLPTGQLVTA